MGIEPGWPNLHYTIPDFILKLLSLSNKIIRPKEKLYNSRKCVCNVKSAIFPWSNLRLSEKTKYFNNKVTTS